MDVSRRAEPFKNDISWKMLNIIIPLHDPIRTKSFENNYQ